MTNRDERSADLSDLGRMIALYRKHVSLHGFCPFTLRDVVRRECLAAERGAVRVSRELLRELRAERAFVGKWCSNREIRQPEFISEAVTAEGCVVISNTDETGTHIQLQGVDHE